MQNRFSNLIFSWVIGSIIIIIALIVSYQLDLPTGYTIVFIASLIRLLSALIVGENIEE